VSTVNRINIITPKISISDSSKWTLFRLTSTPLRNIDVFKSSRCIFQHA